MKNLSSPGSQIAVAVSLIAVMIATRIHHFGSAIQLPDASLAIFFLVGIYLRPAWFFPLFLATAALIDYIAIAKGGVSSWCVTPAYFFLIPTYASVWAAGRWYAPHHRDSWLTLVSLMGALACGTTVAFLISNGSFYLFSGRFQGVAAATYAARVTRYLLPYVGYTFMYVLLAAMVHVSTVTLTGLRASRPVESKK
ncbi:MAG: hypothetical protein ACYDDO_03075 [Acidiferrobacterales bacterium]